MRKLLIGFGLLIAGVGCSTQPDVGDSPPMHYDAPERSPDVVSARADLVSSRWITRETLSGVNEFPECTVRLTNLTDVRARVDVTVVIETGTATLATREVNVSNVAPGASAQTVVDGIGVDPSTYTPGESFTCVLFNPHTDE